ncbi:MAG: glycosyltransferase family 39 protein [Planctomycetia bacterium]|nr:glycosyltransferase family 39 protein [Planctomycetia bacterium]
MCHANTQSAQERADSPVKRHNCLTRLVMLALCVTMLALQSCALWNDSYAFYEHGRLASGLIKLKWGVYSSFRVNPPLPDMLGALPAYLLGAQCPQRAELGFQPFGREEYAAGDVFVKKNPNNLIYLRLGRLCELFFSLLGALTCFYYTRWLFNDLAGLFALGFWVFSPYMNGFGRLVCPDVPAAAMALASVAVFHYWLKTKELRVLLYAGVVLGLAELCKFTLVLFYPLYLLLWALYNVDTFFQKRWRAVACELLFLILFCFGVSVLVVNMGYIFEGSFKPLGDYRFESTLFSGAPSLEETPSVGANRFASSCFAKTPVPLPYNYVMGVDKQRLDFERGIDSYWRGAWRHNGWHAYYFDALLLKTPTGALALLLLAVAASLIYKCYRKEWRDELVIWTPGLALLLFVSSQSGFSLHSRYVIPALPFFFIGASRVALFFHHAPLHTASFQSINKGASILNKFICSFVLLCALWCVVSFLWVYPHEISYFNELTAPLSPNKEYALTPEPNHFVPAPDIIYKLLDSGPLAAPRNFLDSNIDWGQEELRLAKWLEKNPQVDKLEVNLWSIGSIYLQDKFGERIVQTNEQPHWLALSVNHLYSQDGRYRWLWDRRPYDVIGYAVYIYQVDSTLASDNSNPNSQ